MSRPEVQLRRRERSLALFVLGMLWFNAPLLQLFNVPSSVFSVPIVYLWLFGGWLVIILLLRSLNR